MSKMATFGLIEEENLTEVTPTSPASSAVQLTHFNETTTGYEASSEVLPIFEEGK